MFYLGMCLHTVLTFSVPATRMVFLFQEHEGVEGSNPKINQCLGVAQMRGWQRALLQLVVFHLVSAQSLCWCDLGVTGVSLQGILEYLHPYFCYWCCSPLHVGISQPTTTLKSCLKSPWDDPTVDQVFCRLVVLNTL